MTPSLFPPEPIDVVALAELAERSVSRWTLSRDYRSVAKSSDLFELGYSVSHWIRVGARFHEVLEFNPRVVGGVAADLPRITVDNYADQATLHRAIGARVVNPGRAFAPKG